ncbi:MAG: hypothetical protein R3F20_07075 [Planctomycetota bacterium]
MKIALGVVLVLGLALGLSSRDEEAGAAVIAMDVNDLTDGSTLIIRAHVIGQDVAWTEDGNMIVSSFELQPIETLKGQVSGNPVVKVPGGEIDGLKIRNGEAPVFALGEQVVVFLKANADGTWLTYGWFQGKYTLLSDLGVRELAGTNYDSFRAQILAAVGN